MQTAIERLAMPEWLRHLTAESMQDGAFPLRDILSDSLYYAGAGCDGNPVKFFGGNVYSFVYTDYLVRKSVLLANLGTPGKSFLGFKMIGIREVSPREIKPHGWFRAEELDSRLLLNERQHPGVYLDDQSPLPYAVWAVFEREAGRDAASRPQRFSLLHVCAESVAAYSALYSQNGIVPRMLYLINHGFGGNWTNFENGSLIYARTVASHPRGVPLYLAGRSDRASLDGQGPSSARSFWPQIYPGAPLCEAWAGGFLVWKRASLKTRFRTVRTSSAEETGDAVWHSGMEGQYEGEK